MFQKRKTPPLANRIAVLSIPVELKEDDLDYLRAILKRDKRYLQERISERVSAKVSGKSKLGLIGLFEDLIKVDDELIKKIEEAMR